MNVLVSAVHTLVFPSAVSVPKSGCSTVQSVNNTNVSLTGNVSAKIGTDRDEFDLGFGSSGVNSLTFQPFPLPNSFVICARDSVTLGSSYDLLISFFGIAAPALQGNVDAIKVTVSTVPLPLFSMDNLTGKFSLGLDYWNMTGVPNVNGKLYYFVEETDANSSSISLAELQGNISQNVFTVQSQSDYLIYLYDAPRDLFLGAIQVNARNTTWIFIRRYFPATNYLFCGYLQTNDNSSVSNLTCQKIITGHKSDPIYNITVYLNKASEGLSESDRQAFLCYWQDKVWTGSTAFFTNLRGERCSSVGFTPLYKYQG